MANEMPVFVLLECSLSWNYGIYVSINTSSFCVYTLAVLSEIGTVEHNEHVVCSWYGRFL